MSYESIMQAILDRPEDDAPRLALAEYLKTEDPPLSRFIKAQIETTRTRRVARSLDNFADRVESSLRLEHGQRWKQLVGPYLGMEDRHRHVVFERGLPWLISMNPYLFIEQGKYLLDRIAPLRGIRFYRDPDDHSFPMAELAASPNLARLDFVDLTNCWLKDDDLAVFAASPHLDRLRDLDLTDNGSLTEQSARILASHPGTRKCLTIEFSSLGWKQYWPPHEFIESDGYGPDGAHRGWDHWAPSDQALELERELGYIPWLHIDNWSHRADLGYWVEHGQLPCFVPGSPVDALVKLGAPLGKPSNGGESRQRRSPHGQG